jgi:hypothetical protein
VNTEQNTGTVTETNLGGYIAICDCGWTSLVHRAPRPKKRKKSAVASNTKQYEIGRENALKELRAHQVEHRIDTSKAA